MRGVLMITVAMITTALVSAFELDGVFLGFAVGAACGIAFVLGAREGQS